MLNGFSWPEIGYYDMKTKFTWLSVSLLTGILCATGCGGASASYNPPNQGNPILTMYDSSVDFGDVAVGANTIQGATIANTGTGSLTLQQSSVSGAGFMTSGIGQGITLGPGQYVTLAVSFAPSAAGKADGIVSLASNTSSSPINLPLSGNGVVTSHSNTLNWDASQSPVVGYNIYRTPASSESWTKLNSSPILATSYTDWDVQSGNSYLFAVTAVSAQNVESGFSNATLATIP
jgi:hypothetical protein